MSIKEDEILDEYVNGQKTLREIAAIYGVSRQHPVNLAKRRGVALRGKTPRIRWDGVAPEAPFDTPAKLRAARMSLGLRAEDLAEATGRAARTIRAYETGTRPIDPAVRQYLEERL